MDEKLLHNEKNLLAQELQQTGNACIINCDYNSAIEYYKKSIMQNPNNADVSRNLGMAYALIGRSDLAIYYYNKAIELNPSDAKAYFNLYLEYKNKGDIDLCQEHAIKSASLGNNQAKAYCLENNLSY